MDPSHTLFCYDCNVELGYTSAKTLVVTDANRLYHYQLSSQWNCAQEYDFGYSDEPS